MVYYECLTKTFADTLVFIKLNTSPNQIIENTITDINKKFGKIYPWALGAGRDLPNAYVLPKRKKQFRSGRPIVSFFSAPFRPMLNCIYPRLSLTTLPREMSSTSSSSSRTPILTVSQPLKSTTRTLRASSPALTRIDSWTVGDSP